MRGLLEFLRTEGSVTLEGQLAPVAGVTTFAKSEVEQVLRARNVTGTWYGEITGCLRRDPNNQVDPNAVNVLVDGKRIGCLPSYLASSLPLKKNRKERCIVQVFVRTIDGKVRVAAWVWFGKGDPKWDWSAKKFPPMTTRERSVHSQNQTGHMVKRALAEGGYRAEEIRRGMVDGVHYLELHEPIQQLKRSGRLEEALALCYQAIKGAENDRGEREPAPAYTLDAAIIHRKLGQRAEEIQVLERWLRHCPKDRRKGSRVEERLMKLKASKRNSR